MIKDANWGEQVEVQEKGRWGKRSILQRPCAMMHL